MAVSIGELTAEDWATLRRLRLAALHEGYQDSPVYRRELHFGPEDWRGRATEHTHFACYLDDTPVGLVAAKPAAEDTAYVYSLWIDPDARGRGLGRPLVGALVRWAHRQGVRTITLRVRRGNVAARRIYASLGFVASSARPDDGADTLDMTLRLSPPDQADPTADRARNPQASST